MDLHSTKNNTAFAKTSSHICLDIHLRPHIQRTEFNYIPRNSEQPGNIRNSLGSLRKRFCRAASCNLYVTDIIFVDSRNHRNYTVQSAFPIILV